jgi:DNA-binding NarL/FixJ family response regulator
MGFESTQFASGDLRLALVARRRLDLVSMTAFLEGAAGVRLVCSATDLMSAIEQSRISQIDAWILDATFPAAGAFKAARIILQHSDPKRFAFFDDRVALLRAKEALEIPGALYFTRDDDFGEVLKHLKIRPGVEASSVNLGLGPTLILDACSLSRFDRHGISKLSPREQEVMAALAQGKSVREVGESLNLAVSTIDNHKARAMKKLGIHRSAMLANVAISAGLIE